MIYLYFKRIYDSELIVIVRPDHCKYAKRMVVCAPQKYAKFVELVSRGRILNKHFIFCDCHG